MDWLSKTALVVEAAEDRKAEDVLALDVRDLTSFADGFVLATGRSDRQVRAIADAVVEAVRAAGETVLGVEGYQDGRWVLVDLGDVIVHVFLPDVRAHYDLDRLWSDAPTLELGASSAQQAER